MQNSTNSNRSASELLPRKVGDVLEYDEQPLPHFFQWWYAWSAIPEPSAPASFVKRERARRSRLVSIITFLIILLLCIFFPGAVFSPHPYGVVLTLEMIAICFIALFFNRFGMVNMAGSLIVAASQVNLIVTIFTTTPMYELTIALYSLYVISEFLAVSLLPKTFVFIVAAMNIFFIWLSLTYQPKTPALAKELQGQFIGNFLLQVGIQVIVAGIAFIWVNNTEKALKRADRAQVVAALEHRLGQQSILAGQEKQELEESIQQLVSAYVDATKNQLTTKIPYPPAKVLWPLVGVMNALWLRLQRANQVEQDLQRLEQAIVTYTEVLRTYQSLTDQPLLSYSTKTALDPLIAAFGQVHNSTRLRRR